MRAQEFTEAASAAQQAAIAINMKKRHKKPKVKTQEEQLDELSFLGSPCTKDCSGHRAGYAWSARRGNVDSASWSNSFNRGAHLRATGN
jgi:hypothetical protein